jgi:dipeptidase D
MNPFNQLKPASIWNYFNEILQIPRPSKKEEKIIEYLIDFAKNRKLHYQQDKTGNIIIRKPASKGSEDLPGVILQSHIDMVCEKNADVQHDFNIDPIDAYIDGDWVKARGTTLGADDGIGIAAQLAILDSQEIQHSALECLFTVDEETGLTGAFGLEKGLLKHKLLINLDSEDEGEIFMGCAGGVDTLITMTSKSRHVPKKSVALKLSVSGLKGGHSGDDIYLQPGNSVKIINRILWTIDKEIRVSVSKLEGGHLRNAIPREAYAIVTIKEKNQEYFKDLFHKTGEHIQDELKHVAPDLKLEIEPVTEMPPEVMSKKSQKRLLNSIYACPHGVIRWSDEVKGLVETSTNLASVKMSNEDQIDIVTSQRSSIESQKQNIASMVRSTFELAGGDVWHTDGYPGWAPNTESKLLNLAKELYEQKFGYAPEVKAIHAGLECGLFLSKYPGLDMISIGPTIKGAHSPDERLNIETVQKFWDHLILVLENIKKAG